MERLATRFLVLAIGVLALGSVARVARASAASGYYVTFVARDCPSYSDIYANKARNDIVESLEDLGPNTQYGNSGALIGPAYEDLAPQTNCAPLVGWTFTLGTGYVTRAVSGKWGSLSKVTGPYATSIVTDSSTALLDSHGDAVGSQTLAGAVTIKLTDAQAKQASKSSSLWVQGGTPSDPVLASKFGIPEAPDYGFGTLRCATDNVNGDNVEYLFFPSGTNHVFCYAYYVSPPPTSGTVIIRKQVLGASAGASPAFAFNGDLTFDPNGFTLKNGQSITFYRAGGQTWSITEGSLTGYRLSAVNCTSTAAGGRPGTSTTSTSGSTLSIGLAAGDTVECTFVNELVPPTGSLTIAKITEGGVGSFDFLVSPAGGGEGTLVTATSSRDGVPVNAAPESSLAGLAPGAYTISERQPVNPAGGWTLVSAECDGTARNTGDVTVNVIAGQHQTCTFTNKLTPAGTISLSKVTEGGAGTTAFVIASLGSEPLQYHQDATTTKPGLPADALPDSDADKTEHIYLGSYRITEQPPLSSSADEEWTLTSVTCNGVDVPFSDGGAVITLNRATPRAACQFTNKLDKRPPDPEPQEPGEPTPPTTEPPTTAPTDPETPGPSGEQETPPGPAAPNAPTSPEGTTPQPGNVWTNLAVSTERQHPLVKSGEPITDTVVVSNHGPSDAAAVILNYQAHKTTKLISIQTSRGACSPTLPLTCQLGTLKPGQKVALRIVMSSAGLIGSFPMHATVSTSTYDPELSNNSRNEQTYIEPPVPKQPVGCPARATAHAHAAC